MATFCQPDSSALNGSRGNIDVTRFLTVVYDPLFLASPAASALFYWLVTTQAQILSQD
jgi:hypothetical protein